MPLGARENVYLSRITLPWAGSDLLVPVVAGCLCGWKNAQICKLIKFVHKKEEARTVRYKTSAKVLKEMLSMSSWLSNGCLEG